MKQQIISNDYNFDELIDALMYADPCELSKMLFRAYTMIAKYAAKQEDNDEETISAMYVIERLCEASVSMTSLEGKRRYTIIEESDTEEE